jgi:hypothetical protein
LLPRVPCGDQALGVLDDLRLGRAFRGRLLLGGGTLTLHPAAIEPHGLIVAE